jgi:hypothetical protein
MPDPSDIGGRIPDDILDVARSHWRQLNALERRSKDAVTRRLQAAADRVRKRVQDNPESFQAQQARIIELLAEITRAETEREMRRIVEQLWRSGSKLAPAHTETELNQWLQHYGHEARPLNLQALAEVDRELLLERFEESLETWGPTVAEGVRDTLADAMAERAFSEEMVDRVQRVLADKRWKADRIVRTELSQAYNRSHHSTLQYARDELGLGDEMKKSAMATFDARTDEDSFPVHGQVREVGEMFVDGDGRRYLHPPGRPNDREKEIPWMGEEGADRLAQMPPSSLDTGTNPT